MRDSAAIEALPERSMAIGAIKAIKPLKNKHLFLAGV